MKTLIYVFCICMAVALTGCEKPHSQEWNKVEGKLVEVKHFGDSYQWASLKFEDGRVVAFRVVICEANKGTFIFKLDRQNTIYYDNYGDIQKVEIKE